MRTDIKYMNRVGLKSIGKTQRRVVRVIARDRGESLWDGAKWNVRAVAERVYWLQLRRKCNSCGRGYPLTEVQLVGVRQALVALEARGVLREGRFVP
jgi:hypothetical protein